MQTLINNLLGPDGLIWLEALKLFLRKENPWTNRILHIWKSIYIGGLSADKLMAKNEAKGFLLGNEAKRMTKSEAFKTSLKSRKVDFAMKSLKDFGFTGKTFAEWQEFIRSHSLFELCQPEDVYYLRIAYAGQPKDQWARLCMDTIANLHGSPRVFNLSHNDDGLWVSCLWYSSTIELSTDHLWVVRLRK